MGSDTLEAKTADTSYKLELSKENANIGRHLEEMGFTSSDDGFEGDSFVKRLPYNWMELNGQRAKVFRQDHRDSKLEMVLNTSWNPYVSGSVTFTYYVGEVDAQRHPLAGTLAFIKSVACVLQHSGLGVRLLKYDRKAKVETEIPVVDELAVPRSY